MKSTSILICPGLHKSLNLDRTFRAGITSSLHSKLEAKFTALQNFLLFTTYCPMTKVQITNLFKPSTNI